MVAAQSEKSGDGCKRCNCKKTKCLKLYVVLVVWVCRSLSDGCVVFFVGIWR